MQNSKQNKVNFTKKGTFIFNFKLSTFNLECGQSLVELLVAIGLTAVFLPMLVNGLVASREGKAQESQRLVAIGLLQEAQEAARSVRAQGWSYVATNGTFHPVLSGSSWTLISGAEIINGYSRQVVISDVQRGTNGAIVQSGGTIDPSTKQLVTSISWGTPVPSTVSSTMYLTRYLQNASLVDTSVADFTAGTLTGTVITNTSGGEVALGTGASADWCDPSEAIIDTLDLPKRGNSITAEEGAVYVGTGDGTAGITFVNIGISNPPSPATPAASILGTYSNTYQTNAVFKEGNYVYLATNGNTSQVNILDVSTTPYTRIGWINVPSGTNANGIFVENNIAYVTSGDRLYTFNVTTKTGAHSTPLTSIAMWIGLGPTPLAKQVKVVNNHAYVGTGNTLFGMQVFNIGSGGSSLRLVGVSNLTFLQTAQGLAVSSDGDRAYVAFNNGFGIFPRGFFIVDSSPSDPPAWWPLPNFYSILGSYSANSTDPRGMAIASSNRAILVGINGTNQYQVIDISDENHPTFCGGLSIASGVFGVATVSEADEDAYSYIISGETLDEFKIIKGGNGGTFATSGTFESRAFNTNSSVVFNGFTASIAQPSGTSISMQVASAAPVSGNCTNALYTFVGPNASQSAYFTPSGNSISGAVPIQTSGLYGNPAQCFKYKVYFSTPDSTKTPVLYDTRINYSP